MVWVTADWHLTDKPEDEYRWAAFDALAQAMADTEDFTVFHLGDLTDRKDRFSGELVNRLIESFDGLLGMNIAVTIEILMGNHDQPLKGTPFWTFLNNIEERRIRYHTEPTIHPACNLVMLFPFSSNPAEEWREWLSKSNTNNVFMHQPVNGVTENGYTLDKIENMPSFPRRYKVWSGDIHTPMSVGVVNYVGAPHHVKFGDRYPCRMVRLDDDFNMIEERILQPQRKDLIEISSMEELESYQLASGDQAKVRFSLSMSEIDDWPAKQARIHEWASEMGVSLGSVEVLVKQAPGSPLGLVDADLEPKQVLQAYAESTEMDPETMAIGLDLLEEAMAQNAA